MILAALAEYYKRKSEAMGGEFIPEGLEQKEIHFCIVLEADGKFVDIDDWRPSDKSKSGRLCLVPQGPKRTSGVAANLLWDNAKYVLGVGSETEKSDRLEQCHQAFIARIESTFSQTEERGINAVLSFLREGSARQVEKHPLLREILESTSANISFRLAGESQLVCEGRVVREAVQAGSDTTEDMGVCLMTGETGRIARTHQSIKGVWGAQTSGASIVSFNQSAFSSYGKQQGDNAPVSESATFAYTTALNYLLSRGSRQNLHVADMTIVFWADRADPMEGIFGDLFAETGKDDPDRRGEAIKQLYGAAKTGASPDTTSDTKFFVLGLAPNASRLAIRFWHAGTVAALAARISAYFDDIEVIGIDRWGVPGISQLLRSIAVQGKAENVPPNLAAKVFECILEGTPFPVSLVQACLRRIRAEREVRTYQAAIIKAFLVRWDRKLGKEEATVSLDKSNNNVGYRLGRLFAVLERIQETASPGLNATIRDRFYGAASSTPVTVFPHLFKLKMAHIGKLSAGQLVFYEKLIGEIVDGISDLPRQLDLTDQARFSLGYYHQRQSLFQPATESAAEGVSK